mmetsp:Transcript_17410/g.50669  ORF Transcript_17410/g.50669 Transcript_17410/m.50669 type:complete len:516 (-) Transcript_17410:438-1985(-)
MGERIRRRDRLPPRGEEYGRLRGGHALPRPGRRVRPHRGGRVRPGQGAADRMGRGYPTRQGRLPRRAPSVRRGDQRVPDHAPRYGSAALRSSSRKFAPHDRRQIVHPRLGNDPRRSRRPAVRPPRIHRSHQHGELRRDTSRFYQPGIQPRGRLGPEAQGFGHHRGTLLHLPSTVGGGGTLEDSGAGQGGISGTVRLRSVRRRTSTRRPRGDDGTDGGSTRQGGRRRQGGDQHHGGDVPPEQGTVRPPSLRAVRRPGLLDPRGDRIGHRRELRHRPGVLSLPEPTAVHRSESEGEEGAEGHAGSGRGGRGRRDGRACVHNPRRRPGERRRLRGRILLHLHFHLRRRRRWSHLPREAPRNVRRLRILHGRHIRRRSGRRGSGRRVRGVPRSIPRSGGVDPSGHFDRRDREIGRRGDAERVEGGSGGQSRGEGGRGGPARAEGYIGRRGGGGSTASRRGQESAGRSSGRIARPGGTSGQSRRGGREGVEDRERIEGRPGTENRRGDQRRRRRRCPRRR